MKVRPSILAPHWAAAAVEEIAAEYREAGYTVERNALLGDVSADFVARRDSETLVIEVKAGAWNDEASNRANDLRRAALAAGWQYKLVVALPPRPIDVEVVGLEEIVRDILASHLDATPIVDIATLANLESVVSVGLDSVRIDSTGVEIEGDGEAEFELSYGSGGGDDGMTMTDVYPFSFHVRLNSDLTLAEILELSVDTSSFYGDEGD